MAKKKRSRKKQQRTVSVAVGVPFLRALHSHYQDYKEGGFQLAVDRGTARWTGYDPRTGNFNTTLLKTAAVPVVVGSLVHKAAGGLGINRMLSAAGIPFVRI